MFDVYDKVWVMERNKPTQKMVYAVIRKMNFWKNGTEISYELVNGKIGAGIGNNEPVEYPASFVFNSREALLESLHKRKG